MQITGRANEEIKLHAVVQRCGGIFDSSPETELHEHQDDRHSNAGQGDQRPGQIVSDVEERKIRPHVGKIPFD
jgi:hypothetical protein